MKHETAHEFVGKQSPWGKVQSATRIAEGVVVVHTAGHGGIKLDRRRNAQIPALARRPGGWYEEDCEANVPFVFLPGNCGMNADAVAQARRSLAFWFPSLHPLLSPEDIASLDGVAPFQGAT